MYFLLNMHGDIPASYVSLPKGIFLVCVCVRFLFHCNTDLLHPNTQPFHLRFPAPTVNLLSKAVVERTIPLENPNSWVCWVVKCNRTPVLKSFEGDKTA